MINLTLKSSLIGAGLLGSFAAATTYIYLNTKSTSFESNSLITTKSISEFLKEDGLELIKEANGNEWTNKWTLFLDAHQSEKPKDIWEIQDWENNKTHRNVVPQKFKDNCSNNGSQKIENKEADIYKKVKEYCTKAIKTKP